MNDEVIDLNPLIRTRKQAICDHPSVLVDASQADLECEACGKQISPYWYLERIAENWDKDARRIQEYADRIKEHETAMREQHERTIAVMNERQRRLQLDIETLEAKKRQLMAEQVGGRPLGQQVKRWRRT